MHGMRRDQVEQLLLLFVGPLPIRLPLSNTDLPREPSTSVPGVSGDFNQSCDEGLQIGWNAQSGLFRALSGIQVGPGGLSRCPRPTEDPARPRLATVQHIGSRSGIQAHSPFYLYMTAKRKYISSVMRNSYTELEGRERPSQPASRVPVGPNENFPSRSCPDLFSGSGKRPQFCPEEL